MVRSSASLRRKRSSGRSESRGVRPPAPGSSTRPPRGARRISASPTEPVGLQVDNRPRVPRLDAEVGVQSGSVKTRDGLALCRNTITDCISARTTVAPFPGAVSFPSILGRGYGTMAILPGGSLIVYVYNTDDEKNLDYVVSHDGGLTWSAVQTAFMA